MSSGFRTVHELFREKRQETRVDWQCRLCEYCYWEPLSPPGWPMTVDGLFQLVKHLRSHTYT
jgi:hypothetical protein